MAHDFKEIDLQYSVFIMTAAQLRRLDALLHQYRALPMDLADASLVLSAQD